MKRVLALPLPLFSLLRLPKWTWPAAAPAPTRLGDAELRAMSDYELKDLGIGRSEVPGWLEEGPTGRRRL